MHYIAAYNMAALAMSDYLDKGQAKFLRLECSVYLPGTLDLARQAAGFTFDWKNDWGCLARTISFVFCFVLHV